MSMNQINDLTKNFSRQIYKGQGIYKSSGSVGPTTTPNAYEDYSYNPFSDNITISGTQLTSFISPFTKTISKVYFFSRSSAGTHYPVQIVLYENPNPENNAPTWTKKGQSADIAMTTDGLKILSSVGLGVVQGYQYFLGVCKNGSGGGSTTPLVLGRLSGFNNVFSSIASSDLAAATPATFTTNVSSNTVAGWTAGTSSSGTWYFRLVFA